MAVSSTSKKAAMLSITEKHMPVLDISETYNSHHIDEPLLKSSFSDELSTESDISTMVGYDVRPDSLHSSTETTVSETPLRRCSQTDTLLVSDIVVDEFQCSVDGDSEPKYKNENVAEDAGKTESLHLPEGCRSDDNDKTIGVTVETDSGNGGSCCCENNVDELLDEGNVEDEKEELKLLQCDINVCGESHFEVPESGDSMAMPVAAESHVFFTEVVAEDGAAQDVQDDQINSDDATEEKSARIKMRSEATPRVASTSSPSCSPSVGTHEIPVPHIPRLHRQRMGSYGSPPPTTSTARDGGLPQPFVGTTAAGSSAVSPEEDGAKQQQYVVNVHVNPGETFSVCISDQVQMIQGQFGRLVLLIACMSQAPVVVVML